MNSKSYVVDTSIIANFLFRDEGVIQEIDEVFTLVSSGNAKLFAPSLLYFEFGNAIQMSIRRKRMTKQVGLDILNKFIQLPIQLCESRYEEILKISVKFGLTFYDSTYMELAIYKHCELLTLDKQLLEIVKRKH